MNDILKDPDTIEKIKELISANLREDGWAEMAHIGALLSANNINLKANGYKRLRHILKTLIKNLKYL